MRRVLLALFCQFYGLVLMAQPASIDLASGNRGLLFVQLPDGKNYTMAFACELEPGFPLEAAYIESPHSRIIFKETLPPDYVKTLPSNFWAGWTSTGVFSFGENAVFEGHTLYRIEDGHIKIYPHAAQEEARKRYGLSNDQTFLGAFDNRVFYWKKGQPRSVYFQASGHIYRFKLRKGVTQPLGIAKGDPKGDLALRAVVKPSAAWYPSPRTFDWIMLNINEAELEK